MDYIKIRFGDNLARFESEIEKTIEDMFQSINPMFTIAERTWRPQMDMYETPEEVIIMAEIAGVREEDLEIDCTRKAIRIAGVRANAPRLSDARYRLAEIQYGSFERILLFPAQIDPEVYTASLSNGILNIRLAKVQLNKSYRIPIEGG